MALRTYSTALAADPDLLAAVAAEGVAIGSVTQALERLRPEVRRGLVAWVRDPANDGAGLAEWRAAWPALVNLPDAQVRAVMRHAAAKAGGAAVES